MQRKKEEAQKKSGEHLIFLQKKSQALKEVASKNTLYALR